MGAELLDYLNNLNDLEIGNLYGLLETLSDELYWSAYSTIYGSGLYSSIEKIGLLDLYPKYDFYKMLSLEYETAHQSYFTVPNIYIPQKLLLIDYPDSYPSYNWSEPPKPPKESKLEEIEDDVFKL